MTKGRSSESHQQQPGPQLLQNWAGYLLNAKAEGGARGGLLKHWRNLSVFHAFPLHISFTSSFDGKTWPLVIAVLFSSTIVSVYHEPKATIVAIDLLTLALFCDFLTPHVGESSIFFQMLRPQDGKAGPVMSTLSVAIPTSEKRCPCETGSVPLLLESICWSGSHCRCTFTAVGGDFISHELPTATSHLHRKQRSLVGRSSWNLENTTCLKHPRGWPFKSAFGSPGAVAIDTENLSLELEMLRVGAPSAPSDVGQKPFLFRNCLKMLMGTQMDKFPVAEVSLRLFRNLVEEVGVDYIISLSNDLGWIKLFQWPKP